MDRLFQDLKFAVRDLFKHRSFTLAAVLALALGIGASTAIFSILDALWLRPYDFAPGDRLQMMWEAVPKQGVEYNETSITSVEDVRGSGAFQELAAFDSVDINVAGDGPPERLPGVRAQSAFFDALEVPMQLGRGFQPGEDAPGAPPVAVISDRLWHRRFAADPAILGRQVTFNGISHTVVGVLPSGFAFPVGSDVWIPLVASEVEGRSRGYKFVRTIGRLAPGLGLEQARAKLDALTTQVVAEDPEHFAGRSFTVSTVRDAYVGNIRPVLIALCGAVGLLLVIACANVANLLLARATVRSREFAVRAALGASRTQLIGQLLVESLVLALVGATVGILFALWCTDLLTALAPSLSDRLAQSGAIRLDHRVLFFTLGVSMVSAVLFGLVPALHASRPDLHDSLKEGGRTGAGRGRLRGGLVVAELALALVLLVGSGLMLRSLYKMQVTPPGFRGDGLLTFRVLLPEGRYSDEASQARFFETFVARVQQLPGVERVAATTILPLSNSNQSSSFHVVGTPEPGPGEEPYSNVRVITPGYFETMGIRLLQGRDLAPTDRKGQPQVVVINEAFAKKHFPEGNALGARLTIAGEEPWEIVGVVGDVRAMRRGKMTHSPPETYFPLAQLPRAAMSLAVRATDGLDVMPAVRRELQQLDGQQPLFAVRTMDQLVTEAFGAQRVSAGLLSLFAAIALFLAGVGVYAVMAYSVDQKRREIGIRVALGATEGGILRWLVAHGARLTAIGLGIGLLLAFGVSRLLSSQLYEISATDPLTYGGLAALLATIALLATWIPARKALVVDPAVTLRAE